MEPQRSTHCRDWCIWLCLRRHSFYHWSIWQSIHPIAFHSWPFMSLELNYNVRNKELLAIFESFKLWHHYLEGTPTLIDVITDHKNLKYFSTTKILTRQQACWLKFLSQFNLVIHFHPRKLGTKLDTLIRRWDVYPKEGERDYTAVNPYNLRSVFTNKQLASSIRVTILYSPVLQAITTWTLKPFILISILHFNPIPPSPNTSLTLFLIGL